jgi:hypothetical protein
LRRLKIDSNNPIRVNLDVGDKSLKVSRRPGPREDKGKWELVARGIRLPLAVLEVNSKKIPEDLPLHFPEPMGMDFEAGNDAADKAESRQNSGE